MTELRTTEQRTADVRKALDGQLDLWLATADRDGRPHVIAASAWWSGDRITVATGRDSRSAKNLASSRMGRLVIGSPDDVIMIDASMIDTREVPEAPSSVADGFADAVGWDPRKEPGDWVFFYLRPSRIQAYRGYSEQDGRDVMRRGEWLS
jgi:hypothetical protein